MVMIKFVVSVVVSNTLDPDRRVCERVLGGPVESTLEEVLLKVDVLELL